MTNIFIFNNASRAASYGIGTYVKQMSKVLLSLSKVKVSFVEMQADTKEFSITRDENGCCHYLIPQQDTNMESETCCRCSFYFLARNIEIGDNDRLIFQFNYFQHYPLALLLKAWQPKSHIILTVHYMSWCFELLGNVRRMREIINVSEGNASEQERRVLSSFANERLFLHLCDMVIVLSQKTREILIADYYVTANKIHIIYNGLHNDAYERKHKTEGGNCNILFVGRLDREKGLKYLIDAFALIANKHPNANLIIVGDGDFQPYLAQSRKLMGRIAFYGKASQNEIEKLYQSAYVGVMPSFHEQCSYTAIEMMRHGIPVIGTSSTGLSEMLDATPELRIEIDEMRFDEDDFKSQIASRLELLLSDSIAYEHASNAIRKQYEERYTITRMSQNMSIMFLDSCKLPTVISEDFLPHLDDRMVEIINMQPDIDLDFYGAGGIGVYLWWRVLQLEKMEFKDDDQLALIEEHLIYYIDWIEEIAKCQPLSPELQATLIDMEKRSFYPVKVNHILEHNGVLPTNDILHDETTILENALKICTCKI